MVKWHLTLTEQTFFQWGGEGGGGGPPSTHGGGNSAGTGLTGEMHLGSPGLSPGERGWSRKRVSLCDT